MTREQKIEMLRKWVLVYSGVLEHDTWYQIPIELRVEIVPAVKDFFHVLGLDFEQRFSDKFFFNYQKLALKAFKEIYEK